MSLLTKTQAKVRKLIQNRTEFTHANMSGKWVTGASDVTWGRLPAGPKTDMINLLKDRDLYVVYSYLTPIAYGWTQSLTIPDVTYSPTTSGHQSIVRDTFGTRTLPA